MSNDLQELFDYSLKMIEESTAKENIEKAAGNITNWETGRKLAYKDMSRRVLLVAQRIEEDEERVWKLRKEWKHDIEFIGPGGGPGELASCRICCGGEGSLTTNCCGRPMTADETQHVYDIGDLDFVSGKWIAV